MFSARRSIPVVAVIMIVIASILITHAPAQIAPPAPAQPQQMLPSRTISVTGTVVTKTPPDIIEWSLSVRESNPSLATAKHSVDEQMKALFALREQLKIDGADLTTGPVSIQREYERDDRGTRGAFKHWTVQRQAMIRQRDLGRFDEFFEKLSSTPVEVNYQAVSSKIHEVREQTRLQALQIAQKKAKQMAEQVRAKLGPAISISDVPPESFRREQFAQNNVSFSAPNPLPDVASGTFAPGMIDERITVYATFELQ
jgi:uncharacterized protein YggE